MCKLLHLGGTVKVVFEVEMFKVQKEIFASPQSPFLQLK